MDKERILEQGRQARSAARTMAQLAEGDRNRILAAMAQALRDGADGILSENARDLEAGRASGLSRALLDRLMLDGKRIEAMARGLESLTALPDPLGRTDYMVQRPNGLEIGRVRVPLGVVGMIYEARPNVTVDAAGLCVKTGNAVLLRGGSTAYHSNRILVRTIAGAAEGAGCPAGAIALVDSRDREAVDVMLRMNGYLDVLIPRGGAGLIQNVVENATVPVIETGTGICHAYVDSEADLDMAVEIVNNGKTQRPGVCNALETVLVHRDIAAAFLPRLEEAFRPHGVVIRACERARAYLAESEPATEEDYRTEYLDTIISARVVDSLAEAMDHIEEYGTRHSDAIITQSYPRARAFLAGVNSAAVYVNASTRFTDGEMFGFGAEIGISTQKLHARGPMGLDALTTYKYVVYGSGQTRN